MSLRISDTCTASSFLCLPFGSAQVISVGLAFLVVRIAAPAILASMRAFYFTLALPHCIQHLENLFVSVVIQVFILQDFEQQIAQVVGISHLAP
jgi:hypothetical protein